MTTMQESQTARMVPVLRGRDAHIDAVEAGIAAARGDRSHVLLFEGRSGMGKSRLLREAGHRAELAGMRTLAGQAYDGQQALPFAPLMAAAPAGRPPIAAPGPFRSLGTGAGVGYRVVRELRAGLAAAAEQSPIAVVLDDLQWADSATLTAVRTLAADLRHARILWVLADGSDAAPAGGDAWEHLARDGVQRWELAPLPPETTAAIITDFVRAPAGPGLRALGEQADGNPFLLLELLHGLQEENRLTIEGGRAVVIGTRLPRRLTEYLSRRLGVLRPQTRRLMRMAALLPPQFTGAQLVGMLQCRPSELIEAFEEAVRAGLLVDDAGSLRFRHELLRRAVRESLPSSLRRVLDGEVASVLVNCAPAPAFARWATDVQRVQKGVRPRPAFGWASLTETERRVARLVAAGATNQEAARLLFLSPHTINTHLRHVFTKLDINKRVQLANVVHGLAD